MVNSHPFIDQLQQNYSQVNHLICIGLDPDPQKIPKYYPQTMAGIFSFLVDVVDSSLGSCICYKPNISFFEALDISGLEMLKKLVSHIPKTHPVIIDAKRGDIGNTSKMQAKFIFDILGADATTLHPYMGEDSITPFLEYKDKYNFILGLTSNPGSETIEKLILRDTKHGEHVYDEVINQCGVWNKCYGNVGVVVGATQAELRQIRDRNSELLFLIPGVGAQGGRYQAVVAGVNSDQLAVINSSRSILYGSDEKITPDVIRQRVNKIISEM
jgi:orotidine-5'-phosphate decarboxylase